MTNQKNERGLSTEGDFAFKASDFFKRISATQFIVNSRLSFSITKEKADFWFYPKICLTCLLNIYKIISRIHKNYLDFVESGNKTDESFTVGI